jgi:N-acetylglucosamine kinase-like BadF-type ATPase
VNGLKCVIGIDGGGTKTLLRITDLEGRVLTEQTGGLSNICASDRKTVEDNLRDLLNRSLKELPSNREIAAVCIGSAGVVAKENVLFFKEFLKEMTECGNVIVYTDAYVALFANLESKPGVSVTAGTGSICCGKNRQGVFYRVGGWGHLFSDEGSAYAIAIDALKEIVKSHDGREKPTRMTEKMLTVTGAKTVDEIVSLIYMDYKDKTSIAGLSKIVDDACAEGDEAAKRVLEKAAMDLAAMCQATIRNLSLENDEITVVLNGGVFKNSRVVRSEFTRLIKEKYPNAVVSDPLRDAAWGAIYLALESLSPDKTVKDHLIP